MIVLGWSQGTPLPPPEIAVDVRSGIATLAIPEDLAPTPRMRMSWQIQCFAAGIDLVPVAASHAMPIEDEDQFDRSEIAQALSQLSGKGQLSVSLVLPSQDTDEAASGRQWLLDRQAEHQARQAAVDQLNSLATTLPYECTEPDVRETSVSSHFLVAREEADEARSKIAAGLRASMRETALQLSVTGLWPAYGFAQVANEVAA